VPLLSCSPSPRYSEEKGLGDEEPRTGQAITSHHNASLGQARIEPFDRPDTSWERESESSLSTDNQNARDHRGRGATSPRATEPTESFGASSCSRSDGHVRERYSGHVTAGRSRRSTPHRLPAYRMQHTSATYVCNNPLTAPRLARPTGSVDSQANSHRYPLVAPRSARPTGSKVSLATGGCFTGRTRRPGSCRGWSS